MSDTHSNPILQQGQPHQIAVGDAMDTYKMNSNWWAVYACYDLPDFTPSPKWIEQKTGIQVSEVVEALDGLTALGFLVKEGGAFYPSKDKNYVKFSWPKKSKAEIIDQHSTVSLQILNQLNDQTTIAFDHQCFASNPQIITELYKDFEAAIKKAFEKSQQNQNANDGIYKFTFTAVDVVPKNSKQGRGN